MPGLRVVLADNDGEEDSLTNNAWSVQVVRLDGSQRHEQDAAHGANPRRPTARNRRSSARDDPCISSGNTVARRVRRSTFTAPFALYCVIKKLKAYEEDIYEIIYDIVSGTGPTLHERVACKHFAVVENSMGPVSSRIERKQELDARWRPGFGPIPSQYQAKAQTCCGPKFAVCTSACVDPTIRCCLNVSFDKYGREQETCLDKTFDPCYDCCGEAFSALSRNCRQDCGGCSFLLSCGCCMFCQYLCILAFVGDDEDDDHEESPCCVLCLALACAPCNYISVSCG
eukprot:m.445691 g.445691  ORF g.445691 m.445691 type:complete len:285 (-) comp19267_c0_seq1:4879-5733(-)